MLNLKSRVYVAGHRGMVGSAIVRKLTQLGCDNIITATHSECDLTRQSDVELLFTETKPDYVILAAAKVGGIYANNTHPAEFIYENLMIESNIIHQSYKSSVDGLLFLGSSCIYPKYAPQPIKETDLLTGQLEPTNEPYAIAKIAGIKLCESYNRQFDCDFRSVMPTNLYGPGDNFDLNNSHVIPALIHKFHNAKVNNDKFVEVWGSGNVMREFLYVDDMADACITVATADKQTIQQVTSPMTSHINVGSGIDITIRDLAHTISEVVGFNGEIIFDATKPEGTPRKLLDISVISSLGWIPTVYPYKGLSNAYKWFQENYKNQ